MNQNGKKKDLRMKNIFLTVISLIALSNCTMSAFIPISSGISSGISMGIPDKNKHSISFNYQKLGISNFEPKIFKEGEPYISSIKGDYRINEDRGLEGIIKEYLSIKFAEGIIESSNTSLKIELLNFEISENHDQDVTSKLSMGVPSNVLLGATMKIKITFKKNEKEKTKEISLKTESPYVATFGQNIFNSHAENINKLNEKCILFIDSFLTENL
jgi:hypothetical protein